MEKTWVVTRAVSKRWWRSSISICVKAGNSSSVWQSLFSPSARNSALPYFPCLKFCNEICTFLFVLTSKYNRAVRLKCPMFQVHKMVSNLKRNFASRLKIKPKIMNLDANLNVKFLLSYCSDKQYSLQDCNRYFLAWSPKLQWVTLETIYSGQWVSLYRHSVSLSTEILHWFSSLI